jgi:paraquat-inducible protein B
MNKKVSPTLIGTFVVGALALIVIAVLAFGSGRLFRHTKEFVLYFDSSVNGLRVGAPVKFRGVEVGSVKEILLRLEQDMTVQRIPVIIEIDLEKIISRGATGAILKDSQTFKTAIDQGLRGQLQMESLVTGLLYVGFDVFPGSQARFVQVSGERHKYQEIPTVPTELQRVEETVAEVLAKLQDIDLKELASSVTQTVNGVNQLVASPALHSTLRSLEQTMPKVDEAVASIRQVSVTLDSNIKSLSDNLEKTSTEARHAFTQTAAAVKQTEGALKEVETTMASVRAVIDPDSPTFYDLTRTLKEVSAAAHSLRLLANYVERNPRALIFGKPETKED